MLELMSRTWTLIALVIATTLIGYSFRPVIDAAGGALLDFQMNGDDALALLRGMTPEQKTAHFWGTVINDTAYPLAYGSLYAGLLWRFGGPLRRWLVSLAFGAVLFDLLENTTQALALSGCETVIAAKDILTPVKFGFAITAGVLSLVLVFLAGIRKILPRKK
ncbi:MAG: hypothetical protein AAFX52_10505 [Pseudomonadota bacterium]